MFGQVKTEYFASAYLCQPLVFEIEFDVADVTVKISNNKKRIILIKKRKGNFDFEVGYPVFDTIFVFVFFVQSI